MFEPEDERHFALLLPNVVHSEDCLVATRTLVQGIAIVLCSSKWGLKLEQDYSFGSMSTDEIYTWG